MSDLIKRRHFWQLREDFDLSGISNAHKIEETAATPKSITERVKQIPWNWIKKKIYDADILPDRIKRQNLRLFDLLDEGQIAGYCLTCDPDEGIRTSFLKSARHLNPREIENIALFPKQEGRKRGRSFAKSMMAKIFNEGHDLTYLNVSETNCPTLPRFYRRIGMTYIGEDKVPDFNNRKRGQPLEVA